MKYDTRMKVRFVHVSDTHGDFPHLGLGDIVVHSGDLMPNRNDDVDPFKFGSRYGKPEREVDFQERWIDANATKIKGWIGQRPFIYCPGNHDYYDPAPRLKAEGVQVVNLGVSKLEQYDGIPFYGFPFCTSGVHPWNYATGPNDMAREIERMRADLAQEREVILVAHCPPGGILDLSNRGARYGNPALTEFLSKGGIDVRAVLCGHVHADHAIWIDPYTHLLVSNAATTVHYIEMQFDWD
jgi:Icc-related predicted phosphoesterase